MLEEDIAFLMCVCISLSLSLSLSVCVCVCVQISSLKPLGQLLSTDGDAGDFSRYFTINLSPQCRAFSRALKTENLKAPLFPGPVGAGTSNDWCIKKSQTDDYVRYPVGYILNRFLCIIFACSKWYCLTFHQLHAN